MNWNIVAEDAAEYVVNNAKAKWTRIEAYWSARQNRLEAVAKDIVQPL